jgi:hypothetical protein
MEAQVPKMQLLLHKPCQVVVATYSKKLKRQMQMFRLTNLLI